MAGLGNALQMAIKAMVAQRLRTCLTMLGIIIGIASVVTVVALGQGSRERVLENINAMGTSTLEVFPGRGFGDMRSATIETLRIGRRGHRPAGLRAQRHPPASAPAPPLRLGSAAVSGTISGVGAQFFQVRGYRLAQGMGFDRQARESLAQEVVIDEHTRDKLFARPSPLGQVILLGICPAG